MKKIFLALLLPLLMATQCDEDDDGLISYQTDYTIQNNTSVDLIFLTEDNQQIVIDSETSLVIGNQIIFTNV